MPKFTQRLTETFREFVDAAKAAERSTVAAIVDAVKSGLTPDGDGPRKLEDGTKIARVTVNLGGVLAAAGGELRREAKQLLDHVQEEVGVRGGTWAAEGLHRAVDEYVVKPLEAHLAEDKPAAAPAAKPAAKGKR